MNLPLNLPPEKERLQRLVLTLSGEVEALDNAQFERRLEEIYRGVMR